MGITKRSILFRFCERVHITLRQKQRVEQKHRAIMDIYEVELCRHGRWEQQEARFVVATDADEAAYKVTGAASAQRRRTQEGSATRPEAWEWQPAAEAVLRRLRRRAPPANKFLDA